MRNRRRTLAVTGPVPLWRDPRLLGGLAPIAVSILTCVWLIAQARAGVSVYRTIRPVAIGESLDAMNTALADVRIDAEAYLEEGELVPGILAKRSMDEGELVARASMTNEAEQSLQCFVVAVADGLPSSTKPGDTVGLWALPSAHSSRGIEEQSYLLTSATLVKIIDDEESSTRSGLKIEVLVDAGVVSTVLDATSGQESLAAVPVGAS